MVKQWRESYGLSAADLARKAGVSKSYISELEHQRIDVPRKAKREKLAAALGISDRDLLARRLPAPPRTQPQS